MATQSTKAAASSLARELSNFNASMLRRTHATILEASDSDEEGGHEARLDGPPYGAPLNHGIALGATSTHSNGGNGLYGYGAGYQTFDSGLNPATTPWIPLTNGHDSRAPVGPGGSGGSASSLSTTFPLLAQYVDIDAPTDTSSNITNRAQQDYVMVPPLPFGFNSYPEATQVAPTYQAGTYSMLLPTQSTLQFPEYAYRTSSRQQTQREQMNGDMYAGSVEGNFQSSTPRFGIPGSVSMGALPQKTPTGRDKVSGQHRSQASTGSFQLSNSTNHLDVTSRVTVDSDTDAGRLTEPRNYAPRTSGQQFQGPPPRFDLGSVQYSAPARTVKTPSSMKTRQDPFADPFAVVPPIGESTRPYRAPPAMVTPLRNMTIAPYQPGSLSVTDYIRTQRSRMLNNLTQGPTGMPTVMVAMSNDNFPFVESARQASADRYGVVKLRNIPFATKRSEVIAFLGRNSKILNDVDEPVHIIMERVTSKTNDAYVEFNTLEDAMKAVEKHVNAQANGRITRLGDRTVELELSSQAALMKDLFPVAVGVFWNGGFPQILPRKHDRPWGNFNGFISDEEMTMLVKHVEVPHRSPFSKECPQRGFECLISTLKKFPWYMTEYITLRQRRAIHKATLHLIRHLWYSIRNKRDEVNLTPQLLKRVVAAAMKCHGFTAVQKDDIAYLVDMCDMEQRAYGQPRFADSWRHLHALVPKPGVPLDVIEWYIAVIREETNRCIDSVSLMERAAIQSQGAGTDLYFGTFWREINFPQGRAYDNLTLADVATMEYGAIERILTRAFGYGMGSSA